MELKVSYPVKINLLPKKYVVRRAPNWVRLFFLTLLLSFTTFYVYTYLTTWLEVNSLISQNTILEAELGQLREREKRFKVVQEEINRIEKRVEVLKSLVVKEPDWLKILAILGRSMPPDLYLEEASFDSNKIDCKGKAQSIFSVARFIEMISRYPDIFSSADFRSLNLTPDGVMYNFDLSLELKKL
ncbi:MAG: PilN domain-containing protein [Atribacterota bacterium]